MKAVQMRSAFGVVTALAATTAAIALIGAAGPAQAADPIKIGVIAENQAVAGASIPQAAQLAADEINAKGGIDGRQVEIVAYDDHSSAAEGVRSFQRAVQQDGVNAVIASYVSEVVLALEPWAARLKTPMVTPGAASDLITKAVHDNYDTNKYSFHGYLTSTALADSVCAGVKDLFVDPYKMTKAVIFSEDAAWTTPLDAEYEKCLPKIGLEVVDHIRVSPDTTDFTPIFNQIMAKKPDIIITGISHIGTQPVVQWKNQQVPIPMAGINSQASNSTFWNETNGATDGVVFQAVDAPDVPITEKTVPFAKAFKAKYGNYPSYAGYTAYDEVYYIADAVKRAGSTDSDKLVDALEKTDYTGTIGQIKFHAKDDQFAHGLVIGPDTINGLLLQYQGEDQVAVWPKNLAKGELKFPAFVKVGKQ